MSAKIKNTYLFLHKKNKRIAINDLPKGVYVLRVNEAARKYVKQ